MCGKPGRGHVICVLSQEGVMLYVLRGSILFLFLRFFDSVVCFVFLLFVIYEESTLWCLIQS